MFRCAKEDKFIDTPIHHAVLIYQKQNISVLTDVTSDNETMLITEFGLLGEEIGKYSVIENGSEHYRFP